MKAGIAAAVALVGALVSGSAMAVDGNELLSWCKGAISEKKTKSYGFDTGYCLGVIGTVGDLITSINHDLGPNLQICIPAGVKNGQIARILVKYLEQNPEKLHNNATTLTIMATQRAYPCEK